jgi:hypothetical protein
MIHNTADTNVITASEFNVASVDNDTILWKSDSAGDKGKKVAGPVTFRVAKGSIGGVGSKF